MFGEILLLGEARTTVVSGSNAEIEFRAFSLAICEGMWIQRLLSEMRTQSRKSIQMFYDN